MCSSIDKDIEFCDAYMDISQNEKRIVRASVKTYEITILQSNCSNKMTTRNLNSIKKLRLH